MTFKPKRSKKVLADYESEPVKHSHRVQGSQVVQQPNREASCYDTMTPNHDYQPTIEIGTYECTRCHSRIQIEVVPFGEGR